ncbi:deoxyguanosinetriphosphate triphosphohydrolase [Chakrabartyella piscis]|uniref:deoxyguanosinetriphosphate triphosphohydrolase n=1 Tax=Chakrabartyella piscis TaxID=2918914 RepID=UPI0029585F40|nr:deoxyguanosinetriphosphate triphosphohydrolase [Chakrabartyella piscis]
MELRKMQEEQEVQYLSPFATKSKDSKGRERKEEDCEVRTVFQRDRDRILHAKAFRRMKHKTQVFLSPEGDHYRTRLTHTLEVSQIARSISRALSLNEDLTEAIALGHDLGHTPFGHAGERSLDHACKIHGGFAHNEQSLRVVECLEKDGLGLNLTWEVCDGILGHRTSCNPMTMEGKVVQLSDKIAYTNHDVDDAIRAGLLSRSDIPKEFTDVLGYSQSQRIGVMIRDVIENSYGKPEILMSDDVRGSLQGLRKFMFREVYNSETVGREQKKAEDMIEKLYAHYEAHPEMMEGEFRILLENGTPTWRVACDYIACMTDRFAVSKFSELFIPKGWEKV